MYIYRPRASVLRPKITDATLTQRYLRINLLCIYKDYSNTEKSLFQDVSHHLRIKIARKRVDLSIFFLSITE